MTRHHHHTRVYDHIFDPNDYDVSHDTHINVDKPCAADDCDPATRRWVFDDAELAAFTIDITPRVIEALADEIEPE